MDLILPVSIYVLHSVQVSIDVPHRDVLPHMRSIKDLFYVLRVHDVDKLLEVEAEILKVVIRLVCSIKCITSTVKVDFFS